MELFTTTLFSCSSDHGKIRGLIFSDVANGKRVCPGRVLFPITIPMCFYIGAGGGRTLVKRKLEFNRIGEHQ